MPDHHHQAIPRGPYASLPQLVAGNPAFIDCWNERCHPFTWTKSADEILPPTPVNGIQTPTVAGQLAAGTVPGTPRTWQEMLEPATGDLRTEPLDYAWTALNATMRTAIAIGPNTMKGNTIQNKIQSAVPGRCGASRPLANSSRIQFGASGGGTR